VYCYCCYYSFFGQICPVYIAIPKSNWRVVSVQIMIFA
jgi:hypothetical protein